MAASPRQRRKSSLWRRLRNRSAESGQIPWGWMGLTGILYAIAGTVMATLPAPYWIWNVAVGGAIAQALALAGPRALSRFRWWKANALSLLAILGTGAIAVAVGTAFGFVGTDNLEEVQLTATVVEVLFVGFLAIVIAALGAITTAETGDRLLYNFNRLQTTLILTANGISGLGLGALIGFLVRQL